MFVKQGIAVSPGVVTGPALVLGVEDFRIPQRYVSVDAVEIEIARLHLALDAVCDEIMENQELATERLGAQYGAIFNAHLQMVRDPSLVGGIETLIREKNFSPEFASSRVIRKYTKQLQSLGNSFLAERAVDLFDLEKRLLRHLLGERREELAHLTTPMIILANDLTPSETSRLDKKFVLGFATEVGGRTSHTAILAGALEIPAIVGVGSFLNDVSGGESVILDGTHGEIIIDPDEATSKRFRDSEAKIRLVSERLQSMRELRAETKDGVRIQLMGNIEFPEEVEQCNRRGADGVGLYRTEFLYLEKDVEPTEQDHYDAYCSVSKACGDHPVVIRTLDLGADKVPTSGENSLKKTANPVLGLRSIRLSLGNLPLFKTQLRAILRAAVSGNISIMFPLVSTLLELRQAKMIVSDVMEDLEEQNIPFQRDIRIGMMVEVPSAALLVDEFAREVDFLSVGTNDLIQYVLAADRSDQSVSHLYSSGDPSVLRLLKQIFAVGQKRNVPVTVCGEMSSDPKFLPLLVGMGLRHFSVTPQAIPGLKEVVRHITIPQAEEIVSHVHHFDVARDVESYLREELNKICPDLLY